MRTIKRYANRKLYDTEAKQYVTLDGIAALIREGEDVQVIDNETGDDLTAVTLSHIILEQERSGEAGLPKSLLTTLIRTGGDTLDLVRRSFYTSVGSLRMIEQQIGERIDTLVERGEIAEDEGRRLREELAERARALAREQEAAGSRGSGLEAVLQRVGIPTKADVERLSAQLERLTNKLDSLVRAEPEDGAEEDAGEEQ
jgi:polyhydroxyalkanoate synthesis repressor PhaR